MRIAKAHNIAQYWPNFGSQQSAIVIGPVSPFVTVKCWVDDGGICRLFKFINLPSNLAQYRSYTKPIVTFTMASSSERRRARVRPMDNTLLGYVSLLPRKTKVGTASARCCAENKCWRPEFGPEVAAKCIPKLSFQ